MQSQDTHVSWFLNLMKSQLSAFLEGLTAPCKKGLPKPNVLKFKHQDSPNPQVESNNQESFQLVTEDKTTWELHPEHFSGPPHSCVD